MLNPDAALTAWLASMFLAKAILIRRITALGRSMAACNACLGLLFGATSIAKIRSRPLSNRNLNLFRLILSLCVAWVNIELLREARNRWTLVS